MYAVVDRMPRRAFLYTMAKDPAFLFYPGDYITGTMGMSFEEKGAYIELLMVQFSRGHMTTRMIGQTVGQLWGQIEEKFVQDADGLWFNVRLDEEKQKRKDFTASRRNNISGKNQYSKKSGHMIAHMEDENKDKDSEESNNKKVKIPTLIEFLMYGDILCQRTSRNFNSLKFALEVKYQTWVDDAWKDGNNNPITNWKNKLGNTFPHLKPIVNHGKGSRRDRHLGKPNE